MENKSHKLYQGHFNVRHKFLHSLYIGEREKISEQGKFKTVTSLKKKGID